MNYSTYFDSLLKWISAAQEYLVTVDSVENTMYYGTGDSVWGINTHNKALAVFAVTSESIFFDDRKAGMTRQEARNIALSMFRYSIRTHLVGNSKLTDGKKWGHTWISSLAIERIMHAVELLLPVITEEEKELFRRIQLSECDWLCDEYTIEAERFNYVDKTGFIGDYGKTNNRNKPESNIWNGSVLLRASMMFPDAPRIQEYFDRGVAFLVNGISVAVDEKSNKMYNGKTVAELFVGDNFFESYALDHHGYLNLGYAAICLSNIAMIHYGFQNRGLATPSVVFHHVEDLWKLLKTCTFEDGTLSRVGGDPRTRYCYCQDYMIPVFIFAKDVLNDPDAKAMEEKWLDKVIYEQSLSPDGSYLYERCSSLKEVSPLYYTRLESDRALSFSIGYEWNRLIENTGTDKIVTRKPDFLSQWSEPYHGACVLRNPNRFTTWCWRGADGPTGQCLNPGDSHYSEYRHNMFAEIKSNSQVDEIIKEKEYAIRLLPNSFITLGKADTYGLRFYGEAEPDKLVANHDVAVAALPDNHTMIVMQRAKVIHRSYLRSVKGGYFLVQNDIFNGKKRNLHYGDRIVELKMASGGDRVFETDSRWMNFDDHLGVCLMYGAKSLSLYRPSHRQIGISGRSLKDEMLYAEEVCILPRIKSFWAQPGELIVDAGFAVMAGISAKDTSSCIVHENEQFLKCDDPDVRCAVIGGADGYLYAAAANFGNNNATLFMKDELVVVGKIKVDTHKETLSPGNMILLAMNINGG